MSLTPSLSPTALLPASLRYVSSLQLNNIACASIISCGSPCIQSITSAQASIAGVPSSAIAYLNCTNYNNTHRRLTDFLTTSRNYKHVQVVNSVVILTQTNLVVPGGRSAAQALYNSTTALLVASVTSGKFTSVLHNISMHNNATVTSSASVAAVSNQLTNISPTTFTPSVIPTTETPTNRLISSIV